MKFRLITLLLATVNALSGNPISDPNDFPITVWLQSTSKAKQYADAGFNGYTGLVKKGSWEDELAKLQANDLYLIAQADEEAMAMDSDVIMAWMHGDEPDNAQPNGEGGYGPPILPEIIVSNYEAIKQQEPTRPVFLNLSMGVAFDGWVGRGVRTNHPEDYAEYAQGADIVSFDIYPVTASREAIKGKLELVPYGVNRLEAWAPGKPVWTCIECTRINNPNVKPTPHETRAMVWMAIINGARGLVYFSHQFKPSFIEAGLLADPEMTAAVKVINERIRSLAAVIKSGQDYSEMVGISGGKINFMAKSDGEGSLYIFAANMQNAPATVSFDLAKMAESASIEVLDEDRNLKLAKGTFTDEFAPYDVHLYRFTQ